MMYVLAHPDQKAMPGYCWGNYDWTNVIDEYSQYEQETLLDGLISLSAMDIEATPAQVMFKPVELEPGKWVLQIKFNELKRNEEEL